MKLELSYEAKGFATYAKSDKTIDLNDKDKKELQYEILKLYILHPIKLMLSQYLYSLFFCLYLAFFYFKLQYEVYLLIISIQTSIVYVHSWR